MADITINAVGDVWFGDHPVCIGHGINSKARINGPEYFFQQIKNELSADINFCNLETVLSDYDLNLKKLSSCEMRGYPQCVNALSYAGFNLVNVANNHMMQHGSNAFYDTLNLLKDNDISYIGYDEVDDSGKIILYKYRKGKTEIGFVGYSLHEDTYSKETIRYSFRATYDSVLKEISTIKKQFDGCIVCSLHWGDEFISFPNKNQIEFAHKMVESGVSVILGHHPHVLQGVEYYKGGIIAYSLGNFLFDLWDEETRKTAILRIEIKDNSIESFSILPIYINSNYQPVLATGLIEDDILQLLEKSSNYIQDQRKWLSESEYKKKLLELEKYFRYESYWYFIVNSYKYSVRFIYQILLRTLVSKIKNNITRIM